VSIKNLSHVTYVVIVLTLVGCTAFQIRDANHQLTTFYYAKLEAERNKNLTLTEKAVMIENTVSSLNTLSKNAVAQAREETKVENKIAFYRIATTAAWQADNSNVVEYATAGQALCRGKKTVKVPRDCGMLEVIPLLASVDEQTNVLNKLQAKTAAPGWKKNKVDMNDAEAIYESYRMAFKKLIKTRRSLQGTGAHSSFLKAVDENMGTLLCTNIDSSTRGLLSTVGSDLVTKMRGPVKKMKCELVNAGVDTALALCIKDMACN